MAEAKTKPTKQSVKAFIAKLPDSETRGDCSVIAKLMEAATGSKPVMWGTSIVGFGLKKIVYAGGREGDWPLLAFSPRKNLTLYVMSRKDSQTDLLAKLGKHKVSGGCLHIKRLSDVDLPTLKKLIQAAVKRKRKS